MFIAPTLRLLELRNYTLRDLKAKTRTHALSGTQAQEYYN